MLDIPFKIVHGGGDQFILQTCEESVACNGRLTLQLSQDRIDAAGFRSGSRFVVSILTPEEAAARDGAPAPAPAPSPPPTAQVSHLRAEQEAGGGIRLFWVAPAAEGVRTWTIERSSTADFEKSERVGHIETGPTAGSPLSFVVPPDPTPGGSYYRVLPGNPDVVRP